MEWKLIVVPLVILLGLAAVALLIKWAVPRLMTWLWSLVEPHLSEGAKWFLLAVVCMAITGFCWFMWAPGEMARLREWEAGKVRTIYMNSLEKTAYDIFGVWGAGALLVVLGFPWAFFAFACWYKCIEACKTPRAPLPAPRAGPKARPQASPGQRPGLRGKMEQP